MYQLNFLLQVEDECGKIPTVIVQNKVDLIERSQVNPLVPNIIYLDLNYLLIIRIYITNYYSLNFT